MSQDKTPKHDVRTSAGGRGYVADYFVNVLKRHDFTRYINEALAADFACALAAHLERTGQSVTNDAVPDEVWMFQDDNGKWRPFLSEQHRRDTMDSDRWLVKRFVPATPPEAATAEAAAHPADIAAAAHEAEINDWLAAGKAPASVPSDAARDVLVERQRQISGEGWSTGHDDEHTESEMALAAACYACAAAGYRRSAMPPMWPWSEAWWKPANGRRDLVRAGALILAEIERLDRAALAAQPRSTT